MRLRLQELQKKNNSNWKFKMEMQGKDSWEDLKTILHYHWLPYVLELIKIKLISQYYNDMLAGHFSIEKT